ncbi:MAG: hypothetical protein HYW57_10010 [Ignavibacteriales bacterium]|nr:hypothetical protein [Ignavibacteriales bacterium]
MRNFTALFLALLIGLTAVEGQEKTKAISGGIARTAALGGNPYNPYLQDYTDVLTNPAWASKYTNFLYGDAGYALTGYAGLGQNVGFTLGVSGFAVGINVGHREGPMFAENSYGAGVGGFGASDYMLTAINGVAGPAFGVTTGEPRVPVQIYAAGKLGPLTVGAALYRATWSQTDDGTGSVGLRQKAEYSNNQTGIKGGVLLELSQYFTVDGSVLFRLNGSSIDFSDGNPGANPTTATYDGGGSELAINGRAFMKFSDKINIIPQIRFSTFGYQPEITDNSTPTPPSPNNTKPNDYGKTELEFGVGVNSRLEGGWVIVGLAIQSVKLTNDITTQPGGPGTALQTTKTSVSWFDLPKINVGGEIEILSWLSGRVGYFKRLSTQTRIVESPAPTPKTETSTTIEAGFVPSLGFTATQQQLAFGLNILVGPVSLDGYMGERFLAAGPNVLSGIFQDMFGVLSVSIAM